MSTTDPIRPDPAETGDTPPPTDDAVDGIAPEDVDEGADAAAPEDVDDEPALLAERTEQQEDPPFRTPSAGDRLSEKQLADEID